MRLLRWLILLIPLSGCMTVRVENLTVTGGSSVTISVPKTVTVTTDAQVPAGALIP